jgi:lysophospholipase
VDDKDKAGWERSITDYWGRMLSYQLVNATDGGPGYTFSSIANNDDFSNGRYPLPFLVAIGRKPEEEVIALNSTVYEFSPWELGTSDPGVQGYVPLRWAGSNFSNGEIASNGECVRGFDNTGFVMGTSSSLFNAFILYLNDDSSDYVPDAVPDFVISGITSILESLGDANNDIADWTPNPFKGWNSDTNYNAEEDRLTLVDGGEDLQNIPYHPLIRNEREVDVVFSFDNSADTENNWPDGASIIATYERSLENISEGTSFPAVPGKDSFMNLELNTKPVFFGCDASNTSEPSPLIVYIPNYPYVFNSNVSTFTMTYSDDERDAMIQNGWSVATMGNNTRDANWSTCVGCAMLKRSFERTNTTVPERCNECFSTYCWDGRIDEAAPAPYEPSLFNPNLEVTVEDAGLKTTASGVLSLAVAGVVATILSL